MLQYYYCEQKFKIYLLEFLKQQLMENEKELEILRSLGEKNSSENYLEARIQFLRHQVTIQCSNIMLTIKNTLELARNQTTTRQKQVS